MREDEDSIVCKFQPQIKVFYNQNHEVSMEVTDANGQYAIIEIPLERVRQVAKALNAIVKEWL